MTVASSESNFGLKGLLANKHKGSPDCYNIQ